MAQCSTERRWRTDILDVQEDEATPVAIKTGTELKVLEPHEVKAGVAIEYIQAIDRAAGPRDIDPSTERVFILSKR